MSSPAGVDNALKMREMFIKSNRNNKCHLVIGEGLGTVAILTVHDKYKLYFACYYFREDGSYYRGIN